MADKAAEQLSVLTDGEGEVDELALRRLFKDSALQARWQNYHLISDALRNHLPNAIDSGFADRVALAIAAEQPLTNRGGVTVAPWYRPAVGFAVAASVAFGVGVVTLYQSGTPPEIGALAASEPTEPDTALESRLNSYLLNHNEIASMNSVNTVLPYVRMVGYEPRR